MRIYFNFFLSIYLLLCPIFLSAQVYVSTFAGSGVEGSDDGVGTAASFNQPGGIAIGSDGNIYVGDTYNNKIRKITSEGIVSTLAGTGALGAIDGPGNTATFQMPFGIALDASGYIYVADASNAKIRKITPTGEVSTLAGGNVEGYSNAGFFSRFHYPKGVALDAFGNVYIADLFNHSVRKITPAIEVSTFAGKGPYDYGSMDGEGNTATFYYPAGVAADEYGNIYVADRDNHKIRKITANGIVSTLAGSGNPGFTDGTGTNAEFKTPFGLALDKQGNVYVADTGNNLIRKITPDGLVSTVVGSNLGGHNDGEVNTATFLNPTGLAIDISGNIYVADQSNQKIRKISGVITPLHNPQNFIPPIVQIFPNPSNDNFFLYAEDDRGFISINIYNSFGLLVCENQQIISNAKVELPILPQGVYLVKITGSKGEVIRKILKH